MAHAHVEIPATFPLLLVYYAQPTRHSKRYLFDGTRCGSLARYQEALDSVSVVLRRTLGQEGSK